MTQTTTDHIRATLTLALPLIGSHLAQMGIQITDTVMLGWYSVPALAAVVLAGSLYFVIFIVGTGFAWAVMPIVAKAVAGGRARRVRRVTRMGMWLSVAYGAALLPMMWWSDPLFRAIGQQAETAALAQEYLRIAGFGIFPALLVMVLKSYLSALERAQVVLWATVVAGLANAGANYALIFGHLGAPELGVRGAAIASILTQGVMLVALAIYAAWVLPEHTLFARIWRADWPAFFQVFRLGWPIGLTSLSEAGMFTAATIMVGWLGTVPLAAHGVALQLASLSFMLQVGLSQAATVRAGAAQGRKSPQDLIRGAQVSILLSVVFAALGALAFVTIPETLISGFVDPQDPALPAIMVAGTALLVQAALFQLADGQQVVVLGLLRGVQDTRVPMWLGALGYWGIGVPAGYALAFPLGQGAVGVWQGLVIGLIVAAALLHWRFWRGQRGS